MRMGIGIGWPNASASNQSQMVYFLVSEICGEGPPGVKTSTQLVDNSIYHTGDYVEAPGLGKRVLLGSSQNFQEGNNLEIIGPVYNSCGI
jgi:hypothetical protein